MELVGPEIPIKEMSKEEIETRWFNMLRKIGKAFNNCLNTLKDNSIIIDKNLSYNVIKTKVKKILVEKNIEHDIMLVKKISKEIKSNSIYIIPKNKRVKEN